MPNAGPGPVTGRVRPSIASALSGFDGHPVAGAWTLRITDSATGDAGTLRRWGVQGPQVACPRAEIPQAQTGAASGVSTTTARLTGTVTPNGRETGRRFAYGTTTAYGSTHAGAVRRAPATPQRPARPRSADWRPRRRTTSASRRSARTASSRSPAAMRRSRRRRRDPAADPRATSTAPRFLGTLTAKPGSRVRGKRRVAFGFRLSEAATVRVVLTRRARGGRSKGRCVAPRTGRPRCTRQLAAGSASRAFTPAGSTRLRFTPSKRLGKGVYTAKLTATDAAGNRSKTKTVRFTVR